MGVCDGAAPAAPPQIVVHAARGGDQAVCRWFIDGVLAGGVDFDVIGLSFYPWWHGTLQDLARNLAALAGRYRKPLMVIETAYPWTLDGFDDCGNFVTSPAQLCPGYPASPAGQAAILRDLLAVIERTPGGDHGRRIHFVQNFQRRAYLRFRRTAHAANYRLASARDTLSEGVIADV